MAIWVKVFKNGPSKIYGRQPLKNLSESHMVCLGINFSAKVENKDTANQLAGLIGLTLID